MGQRNWMKQYGIHMVICTIAMGIAFGINWKIDLDRSHVYEVSEPIYTLLKEITQARIEGKALVLSGWGFDTNYYSKDSTCELILQDTETGEALWPKMKKNPEPAKIAERYTDGEDYSAAAFEGRLKTNKLKNDSVYEILLRYTASYTDENGNKQLYVRTVTTDEFFYQGKMMAYNPKTFVAPEVAGTELEKVVGEGEFCYFSQDGMYIYIYQNEVCYIAGPEVGFGESGATELPLHIFPVNADMLEGIYREVGFENRDIMFESYEIHGNFGKYRVAVRELPNNYEIAYIETGLYSQTGQGWVWKKIISMVDGDGQ